MRKDQYTTLIRRARLAAFAAQAATSGGASSSLQITALRHYPLREPVSGRTYTVIKLQTRGGLEGYGECASVTATDLAQTVKAVVGKEATQFETVRFQLKSTSSGLSAALNMAMLDVVGRSVKAPVYQVLGGPTQQVPRACAPRRLHGRGTDSRSASGAEGLSRVSRANASDYRPNRGRRSCWRAKRLEPWERRQVRRTLRRLWGFSTPR